MPSQGKLYVVGIGPGSREMMSVKAIEVIKESDYVVGYKTYIDRINWLIRDKGDDRIITTPMRREIDRVEIAINLAKKYVVSLVSGGDPGVYGILPLVIEYVVENDVDVEIEVIPGITAAHAASALLGSPISGDHAVVSLSDLLVPWDVIEKRLIHAIAGDFVIAIYNPSSRSRERKENFRRAVELIKRLRGDVIVGIVKNAFREGQVVEVRRISEVEDDVDMSTILIVGNSETAYKRFLYTPRGYSRKYSIGGESKPSKSSTGVAKMGAKTRGAEKVVSESERILRQFYPEDGLVGDIVRRCISATGDASIKDVLRFKGDIMEGVRALKDGCRIITDVHMVKAGLRRRAICAVDFADDGEETRTASGIMNLKEIIKDSVVAIGNSPTAAIALHKISKSYPPRFIVATPVGFVKAAESKEMIRELDIPSITTEGTRGGSGLCAAIVNCLIEHAERPD